MHPPLESVVKPEERFNQAKDEYKILVAFLGVLWKHNCLFMEKELDERLKRYQKTYWAPLIEVSPEKSDKITEEYKDRITEFHQDLEAELEAYRSHRKLETNQQIYGLLKYLIVNNNGKLPLQPCCQLISY